MKLPYQIIERPSPNYDARRAFPVDMVIIHYTGMRTAKEALDRLCDAEAKVSAHYLIDRDGVIHQLVEEDHRAWHAGVSSWDDRDDINSHSIGIELVNRGHEWGYEEFPKAQLKVLYDLLHRLVDRYPIPPYYILGHSDVAPDRKDDPGEFFPWEELAQQGLGLWPAEIMPFAWGHAGLGAEGAEIKELQDDLASIGYPLEASGEFTLETEQVVAAFQRHWRRFRVDGVVDAETRAMIRAVRDEGRARRFGGLS